MFSCKTRGFCPSCHAKRVEEWGEWMRVDPMVCPKCGGQMKVIAFITDYQAVDRIIDHLKLVFVAEKPPPSRVIEQVALMAAEERAEYF